MSLASLDSDISAWVPFHCEKDITIFTKHRSYHRQDSSYEDPNRPSITQHCFIMSSNSIRNYRSALYIKEKKTEMAEAQALEIHMRIALYQQILRQSMLENMYGNYLFDDYQHDEYYDSD